MFGYRRTSILKYSCRPEGKLFYAFILFSCSFFSPFTGKAQFEDHFTDGDFTNNPTWFGDTGHFVVHNGFLRLYAPEGSTYSWLATQSYISENTEWEFLVKLAFTPSDNNYPRIYLCSDNNNLSQPLNGYYLRIGKNGSDNKRIYLYRQNGLVHTELLAGADNIAGGTNNLLRIKVSRDETGQWTLMSDPLGGFNYQFQGAAFDNQIVQANCFGVACNFTPSNYNKFYFADFVVKQLLIDTIAPEVIKAGAVNVHDVEVLFNEPLEPSSALNPSSYMIGNLIGHPQTVAFDSLNSNTVKLKFEPPLVSGSVYSFTIDGVKDLCGNMMNPWQGELSYYQAGVSDIVISEIMADPEPSIGLPQNEYIEIYNRTAFPISIKNWTLHIGNAVHLIPEIIIYPETYYLMCSEAGLSNFNHIGNVSAIEGLSSTALINAGTSIALHDQFHRVVHAVNYKDYWYADNDKSNGGWSLEMIDTDNPCGCASNWKASICPLGGTPSAVNSVNDHNPDVKPPYIKGICILNDTTLRLSFSEYMDSLAMLAPMAISINGIDINQSSVKLIPPFYDELIIETTAPFVPGWVYSLITSPALKDCSGNTITNHEENTFVLHDPSYQDIIITEIMADPSPVVQLPESPYLEIFNRSDLPVTLQGWHLSIDDAIMPFGCESIPPNSYRIICHEKHFIKLESFGKTIKLAHFPTVSSAGADIGIRNSRGQVITNVSFSGNWIKEPQKRNGGWSLERKDIENLCESSYNWDASKSQKGGTPGVENSILAPNPEIEAPTVLRAGYRSPNEVTLHFDKSLDSLSIKNTSNYEIAQIGKPLNAVPLNPSFTEVLLLLPSAMNPGQIYEVRVNSVMGACNLLPLENTLVRVAIPQEPLPMDIVINEVLFNPWEQGFDYVEIVNRSQKVFDLKNFSLVNLDTLTGFQNNISKISDKSLLLFPGDYLALTMNPEVVKQQYKVVQKKCFAAMIDMPSMPNDEGSIALTNIQTEVIDRFVYNENMHFQLLSNKKGVSLERIFLDKPTQQSDNWHSASETSGFGTPAYKNSQSASPINQLSKNIELVSDVISPDNDGKDDILLIGYSFEQQGVLLNISIFDAKGRLIKNLEKNHLAGTKGTITWDGITENSGRAQSGIHIIYIEAILPDEKIEYLRLPIVVI